MHSQARKKRTILNTNTEVNANNIKDTLQESTTPNSIETKPKAASLSEAQLNFFTNIIHEFQTPLGLIISQLHQVLPEVQSSLIQRSLSSVLNNSEYLLELANQMLDLSKMEEGHLTVRYVQEDIIAYTRSLMQQFEPLTENKQQKLIFLTNRNCWNTQFDKDKWTKIIYNILSNAIKFTPNKQYIQLTLTSKLVNNQEFINLNIKDAGQGLDAYQMKAIFNRYFQTGPPSHSWQGSSGIGLTVVKELIELQKGTIKVYSKIGKGTTFQVLLPIQKEKGIIQTTSSLPIHQPVLPNSAISSKSSVIDQVPANEKLQVLLIEDQKEMRDYIRSCINAANYQIFEATNGQEGLDLAQLIIPDLIISDVKMPDKSGLEVLKTLRQNLSTSHIPVILLTAQSAVQPQLDALQNGADAYLTKPFSPRLLTAHIKQLIASRQLLQKRYQENKHTPKGATIPPENPFITQLKRYILQHLDAPILNGSSIGKEFAMSRSHLHKKLKALTGQSISEFVKIVRLEQACQLLLDGQCNLSEITYATGFSSLSYFSRSFKKYYGQAPSEYLKQRK